MAPAALNYALRCLEQVDDGARLVIAEDLMSLPSLARLNLEAARTYLEKLLADADTSNADIKGILNRLLVSPRVVLGARRQGGAGLSRGAAACDPGMA